MESEKIYEESYESLTQIQRQLLTGDIVNIDLSKLDTESAGALRTAISQTISNRQSAVYSVITGVK